MQKFHPKCSLGCENYIFRCKQHAERRDTHNDTKNMCIAISEISSWKELKLVSSFLLSSFLLA